MFKRSLLKTTLVVLTLTGMQLVPAALRAETNSGLVADSPGKALRLWYDEPAPDSDDGWADRSIPMGNGYMGVNVFGGTATERIQITENSLYDSTEGRGLHRGGLNNFAEVYIDFGHNNAPQLRAGVEPKRRRLACEIRAGRCGVFAGVLHQLPRQGDGDPLERIEGGGVVVHAAPDHSFFERR